MSLVELKNKIGNNLDIKHTAWIVNRVLEILTWTHSKNLCHLAVLPQHIIINPKTHGGVLIDWGFSTQNKPFALASTKYGVEYSKGITKKEILPFYIDIEMAFKLFKYLSPEEEIPPKLESFINLSFRSINTFDILNQYNHIIDKCWKREFLQLNI